MWMCLWWARYWIFILPSSTFLSFLSANSPTCCSPGLRMGGSIKLRISVCLSLWQPHRLGRETLFFPVLSEHCNTHKLEYYNHDGWPTLSQDADKPWTLLKESSADAFSHLCLAFTIIIILPVLYILMK